MRAESEDFSGEGSLSIEDRVTQVKASIPKRDANLRFRQKVAVEICNSFGHLTKGLSQDTLAGASISKPPSIAASISQRAR